MKIFSGWGGILCDQKEYLAVRAMYSMIFFYGVRAELSSDVDIGCCYFNNSKVMAVII